MANATRIMLVEDEGVVALQLRARLELLGYQVVEIADSGSEAVRLAQEHCPDLILMDIRLRGAMDGIEAARAIRSRKDVPIIYLTAYADDATVQRAKITEPHGYLVKPFEDQELSSTIEVALYKHEMERRLRESEARFRRLAENARDAIFRVSIPDGRVEYMSRASLEVFGCEPQAFYDQADLLRTLIVPPWREAVEEQWQQVLTGDVPSFIEYQVQLPSGEIHWVLQRNVPVMDDEGELVALEIIATDITERQQAEQAVRDSHARLFTVLDGIDAHIHVVDLESREVLYANQSMQQDFGDVLIGKICYEVFHGRDEPCEHCLVSQLIDRYGEPTGVITWEGLNPTTGRWYVNHDRAMPWVDGRLVRLQVAMDITDRREAEVALRESKERFQQISSLTSDLAYASYLNPQGRLVSAWTSGPIERLTGKNGDEFHRRGGWLDYAHSEDLLAVEEALAERLAGKANVVEFRARHADGRLRWLRDHGRPVRDPASGEVIGILGATQDITEQHETDEALRKSHQRLEKTLSELQDTQQQLVQQERLAAVGQLAAGIAHDFNNILAVIVLESQLGLFQTEVDPILQRHLHTIRNQAGRAADLVQQILDYSRQSLLEQRPLDLVPLLKEQTKLLRRTLPESIRIELELDCRPEDCIVHADLTRMQQMIMNLVFNARDAMLSKGDGILRLQLSRQETTVDCVTCGQKVAGVWVRLTVSDTGVGIKPELLPRIFEPFFTTRAPLGSGLGLAQVYGIVSQHGGHIEVTTDLGIGSTFGVYLPVWENDSSLSDDGRDHSVPRGNGQLILVAEDEPIVRSALEGGLRSIGYRVEVAADGQEALDVFEDHPEIALVLSDVVMPNMNGLELCRKLKQRKQNIPVLLLTGYSDEHLELGETGGVAAGWLKKPVSLEELAQQIAAILKTE